MDYKPVFENGLRACGLHDWLQVFNYAYLMNMYFSEHLFLWDSIYSPTAL